MLRYAALVLDHDDTVVESTPMIHYPSFLETLGQLRAGESMSESEFMLKCFDPGFYRLCREQYRFTDEEMQVEQANWERFVASVIPSACAGIKELLWDYVRAGGHICVVSHSMEANIRRDYHSNGLPEPELVFGWDYPVELRKPSTFALESIMKTLSLAPGQLLVVDDLRLGYDMAKSAGVPFACAGWGCRVPEIERIMRSCCERYLCEVNELRELIFIPE